MKLLLTGGTGFIGSRLALEARRQHLDVVVAGQLNTAQERARQAELEAAGVQVAIGPLQNPDYARQITAGCQWVIHLAAAQHEANVPDSYFRTANVEGTRTLLEASRAAGVQRFVHGSTIGVYGSASQGALDESSPPHPDNIYGQTKLEAEAVVKSFRDKLPYCIVRISETYGPGDYRLLKLFRAIDRRRFPMIGAGRNHRQCIHVSDLARLLLLVTESPAAVNETFIGAGNELMTTADMVNAIAQALGRKPLPVRLPLWPFVAAATVLETTLRPLGIQPPLHRRRLDFFRKSFVFSTDKAQGVLGFTSRIRFADGARETAAWYRDHRLLGK